MWEVVAALGLRRRHIFLCIIFLLPWLATVVSSGAGWNPFGRDWDFSNTGAFGDSFGPLNTFMALLAALGAIAAYKSQSEELRRAKARQEELDEISMSEKLQALARENEIDRRAAKVSFENSFFNLLGSFRNLVGSIDVKRKDGQAVAHDAFDEIVRQIRFSVDYHDADVTSAWILVYKNNVNDLNHYFRFLYHVVLYIHESDVAEKYFYVRLLRAMLSEAELVLLALNCEYGQGREKFKILVTKYALLHNISKESKERWNLSEYFASGAFNHEAEKWQDPQVD